MRVWAAALAVFAAVAVGAPLAAAGPEESSAMSLRRVAGPDRYATAALVAQLDCPDPERVLFVVNGTAPADALALGTRCTGPLLYVTREAVPEATLDAIGAIAPADIVVVGGTGVVSGEVAAQVYTAAVAARNAQGGP